MKKKTNVPINQSSKEVITQKYIVECEYTDSRNNQYPSSGGIREKGRLVSMYKNPV